MKAYTNRQEARITIHKFDLCEDAKVGPDEKIRHVLLNPGSISKELDRFRNNKHPFSEEPYMNDMWLIFDFQDGEFEVALMKYIMKLIGFSDTTIGNSEMHVHC